MSRTSHFLVSLPSSFPAATSEKNSYKNSKVSWSILRRIGNKDTFKQHSSIFSCGSGRICAAFTTTCCKKSVSNVLGQIIQLKHRILTIFANDCFGKVGDVYRYIILLKRLDFSLSLISTELITRTCREACSVLAG